MSRTTKMIQLAIGVAEDDSHGYSQTRRWPWQGSDYDCSSLMYWAAHEAGYDVPLSGYTGTMLGDFSAAGFTAIPWGGSIWDCEPGDILLAHNGSRQHTEMYVGDGQNVGAHIAETGDVDGAPGDQTGNEISIAPNGGSWDYILRPPESGESEDDMTPEQANKLDFIYQHLRWNEDTHWSNLGNLVVEQPVDYPTVDAKGASHAHTAKLGERIGYIDQRTHVIEERLTNIEAALAKLAK